MPLASAVELFRQAAVPWWVSGGYAIELAVGRSYRDHGDLDVSLLRRDQLAVRRLLSAWDCHVADSGTLRPWPPDEALPETAYDIWVREHPGGPWRFQLMLDEADGADWIYRRDPRIRRELATLTIEEPGFHRLAPEVQLLYKSKGPRPKDEQDFTEVLPTLTEDQRHWLDTALQLTHPTHPWRGPLHTQP
ncbi:amino acid transporter [Nonomuraea sp. B12E4]|uniref:nucleotidyltransferase domain-containing protein n=1 Tax=Nonomuraea sp. B12E4 TaxID=3153564 RepID=UPI00325CCC55